MDKPEIPVGFSMALTQNPEAMQKFASLSEDKKQAIIEGTHTVSFCPEMHRYVENIKNAY